jgi:phospholipid/cholesterol/gamma-HCH transport system permease protein
MPHLSRSTARLAALPLRRTVTLDGEAAELDTAAAPPRRACATRASIRQVALEGFSATTRACSTSCAGGWRRSASPPAPKHGVLARIGRTAEHVWALVRGHVNFLGLAIVALAGALARPATLRLKELTVQLEQVCLNAIPVIILVTGLIGMVFAYLLGMQASQYGANIFVVDGVAIGMTRELAPMLVAIIMAGRSGAWFTAQLGTMMLTEVI